MSCMHAGVTAGQIPPAGLIADAVPLMAATATAASAAGEATGTAAITTPAVTLTPETPLAALLQSNPEPKGEGAIVVSTNLPPVPKKLVEKIWRKEYIDLDTLLPARLGTPEPTLKDFMCGEKKKEKKEIATVQEWVVCFNTYMAIVLMKDPNRAKDLLAYSSLIVKASSDYKGEAWLGYDRFFRRQAAAEQARFPKWGEISPSIWTQHFGLATAIPTCEECGSRDHVKCKPRAGDGEPSTSQSKRWERRAKPYSTPRQLAPVCKRWNGGSICPAFCSYRHVCLECGNEHRARNCPQQQQQGASKESKEKLREEEARKKQGPFRPKRT